jgi:hypothetical protein
VLIDYGVAAEGSLPAQARNAGLGITGWAPVTGEMFWTLREHCSPDLPLAQLAARLGFTVQQWKLMEAATEPRQDDQDAGVDVRSPPVSLSRLAHQTHSLTHTPCR